MKSLYVILALCLLVLVLPVSGVAQVAWFNDTMAQCVTAVDTNDDGTLIIAGYNNGTIIAFEMTVNISDGTATAVEKWRNKTNATIGAGDRDQIQKIVADSDGNCVWISELNEAGYISSTGAIAGYVNGTGRDITDIALNPIEQKYAVTEANGSTTTNSQRVTIYNIDGTVYAQNTSFGSFTNWTQVGYDPNNQWLVTANRSSNRLQYWNITSWFGWTEFNPTKTASKNSSQIWADSFPYRESINVTYTGTTYGIVFVNNLVNTSASAPVVKINNTLYEYNRPITGNTFWWMRTGNLSNITNLSEQPQNGLLNLSITNGNNYYVVFRPIAGLNNFTFYFGNTSLNNSVANQSWTNNGTLFRHNFTASQSWVVPFGVDQVNVSMIGGGGSGNSGGLAAPGFGGSRGLLASYSIITVPGSTATIGVGAGGYKPPGFSPYVAATNSSFSNGTAFYAANGTQGGSGLYSGESGNITIPGYPSSTSGVGGSVWVISSCIPTSPGAGNTGFGAGGGGGGQSDYTCMNFGNGGDGANGVVQVSYYINDVPVYYYGAAPTTTLHSLQIRSTGTALNASSVYDYVGNVIGLSVPNTGGLASISTDVIFYQHYITSGGFGDFWCATRTDTGGYALFAGVVHDVKASNSGAASASARGAYGNVYDANAVTKGSVLTGNTLNSIDTAMSSGSFVTFGGDEGKIYMVSNEGSPTWYTYYTGSAGAKIYSVATSWNGECVVVGRADGLLEYFNTNVTIPVTPTPSYVDVLVYAFKDSVTYANQPVTIYSSTSTPYSWVQIGTSYTDGGGKFSYTTSTGTYYKFVVNNVAGTTSGEGEAIWQSNTGSTTVYIHIITPSTPYEWNAYYNADTDNVTVVYSDSVTPTNVLVDIKDLKTGITVLSTSFPSDPSWTLEYHDQLGNGSYQVSVVITRLGASVRDQRIVTSPTTYGTILPIDNYMTWAISTFILMLIAGMFSYANSKRGALVVVLVAVFMMVFNFLPWSMVTVAMLAAIFAVMSLFGSRVQ